MSTIPPLPKPELESWYGPSSEFYQEPMFSADQMREYALAAIKGDVTEERAKFAQYLQECDEFAIVPDVAGAFHWAFTHAGGDVPQAVIALYKFMDAAFVPFTPQQEQIQIQLDLARVEMTRDQIRPSPRDDLRAVNHIPQATGCESKP
jgi:hypothetical protein